MCERGGKREKGGRASLSVVKSEVRLFVPTTVFSLGYIFVPLAHFSLGYFLSLFIN